MVEEYKHESAPDRAQFEPLINAFVEFLIRERALDKIKNPPAKNGLPPRKLALILDYISHHLHEDIPLEKMAAIADVTPSYFIKIFKQSTGLAPHQYVMMLRLEKAKTLLTETSLKISEIAEQTGFADQSHLTRLMRRHTGLTPLMFRNK